MPYEDFVEQLKAGAKKHCPTCERYAQVYKRRLHTSVALQLITLYKLSSGAEYVHVSRLVPVGSSGAGDFTKAKYWGLVEEQPAGEKSNGFWRLTEKGIAFVTGKETIQKVALVYDDRVISMEGENITIEQCLSDKFNYSELMAA